MHERRCRVLLTCWSDAHEFRARRGPDRDPRDGPRLRGRAHRAARPRLGPGQDLPGRDPARSGRPRHGGHLRPRGCRRFGALTPRRDADLRGAQHRLPDRGGVSVDPQHVRLDDRRLRRRRSAPALAAVAHGHGADRQLLPDRAGLRLRRRGAPHPRRARRRPLRAHRREAVHLGRRRQRPLRLHGPHRRGRAFGHLGDRGREGHARPLLRRRPIASARRGRASASP
jgi:hypothetical protein